MPLEIGIDYDPPRIRGALSKVGEEGSSPIWERLRARFSAQADAILRDDIIDVPWPEVLNVIREFGSASTQKALGFRLVPTERARAKVATFVAETKQARVSKDALVLQISEADIQPRLTALGFNRELKPFQLRDLARLLSLPHGANFSVPGAGKTTVTFALSLLAARPDAHLFVVAPKSAFPAWRGIVAECVDADAPDWVRGRRPAERALRDRGRVFGASEALAYVRRQSATQSSHFDPTRRATVLHDGFCVKSTHQRLMASKSQSPFFTTD